MATGNYKLGHQASCYSCMTARSVQRGHPAHNTSSTPIPMPFEWVSSSSSYRYPAGRWQVVATHTARLPVCHMIQRMIMRGAVISLAPWPR